MSVLELFAKKPVSNANGGTRKIACTVRSALDALDIALQETSFGNVRNWATRKLAFYAGCDRISILENGNIF